MDKVGYEQFVKENDQDLGVIIAFMEHHGITEIILHAGDNEVDVTMDLTFGELKVRVE